MQKHQILLIAVPVLLAGLVFFLTGRKYPKFRSQAIITCSPVPGGGYGLKDQAAESDGIIALIRSHETLRETGIRLLSQHLLLDRSDARYISAESYSNLISIIPSYISKYVAVTDSGTNSFGSPVDRESYEQTVRNLTGLAAGSDTNFVSRLMGGDHPHYSIKALSHIKVRRIGKTGLVKLVYESGDPGISQQTLSILTDVCTVKYSNLMQSGNDQLIKDQDQVLKEEPGTTILSISSVRGPSTHHSGYTVKSPANTPDNDLASVYRNKKIVLEGLDDYIGTLEEKLSPVILAGLKSEKINQSISRLEAISLKFASTDLLSQKGTSNIQKLAYLNLQAGNIKEELRALVNDLGSNDSSADRSAYAAILSEWTDSMIEAVNIRANLKALEGKLNSAGIMAYAEAEPGPDVITIRMPQNLPAPSIRTVDPPGYPVSSNPAKRYLIILGSALLGFIVVLSGAWSAAHFDDSLGGPGRAAGILQSGFAGVLPEITDNRSPGNTRFVMKRLLDVIIRNFDINIKNNDREKPEKIIIFFSMQPGEGKTFTAGNLSRQLIRQRKNILYLNYSAESLIKNEIQQTGSDGLDIPGYLSGAGQGKKRSLLLKILAGHTRHPERNSTLFDNPSKYLESTEYLEYTIERAFLDSKSYWDILIQNSFGLTFIPDYVFIELPPLLCYQYPQGLFAEADLPVLVCRSDRKWSEADQLALKTVTRLTKKEIHFILNRADGQALESVLGEFS